MWSLIGKSHAACTSQQQQLQARSLEHVLCTSAAKSIATGSDVKFVDDETSRTGQVWAVSCCARGAIAISNKRTRSQLQGVAHVHTRIRSWNSKCVDRTSLGTAGAMGHSRAQGGSTHTSKRKRNRHRRGIVNEPVSSKVHDQLV